jgi:N,N'-diacetyllegionaminate synthase
VGIYVIAAVGSAHGGSLDSAKRLILSAKESGADAVKFHSFRAATLAHPMFAADQHAQLKPLELTREQHFELAAACQDSGLDFIATAFDFAAVDLLAELGAPYIRIASGDATNLPLIAHAARCERPLLLGTAMCSLAEAADAYYCAIEEGAPRVVLLHGTSAYPTPQAEVNLQALSTLAGELFCEVGFSDHTIGIDNAVGAAALGAVVIEKHLAFAAEAQEWTCTPEQFAGLAQRVRQMDVARGDGDKRLMPSEQQNAELTRRSVFYSRDIPGGQQLTRDDLAFLRPVIGLSPAEAYRFVGRKLGVDMGEGELASEQDIAVVELKQKPAADQT